MTNSSHASVVEPANRVRRFGRRFEAGDFDAIADLTEALELGTEAEWRSAIDDPRYSA